MTPSTGRKPKHCEKTEKERWREGGVGRLPIKIVHVLQEVLHACLMGT